MKSGKKMASRNASVHDGRKLKESIFLKTWSLSTFKIRPKLKKFRIGSYVLVEKKNILNGLKTKNLTKSEEKLVFAVFCRTIDQSGIPRFIYENLATLIILLYPSTFICIFLFQSNFNDTFPLSNEAVLHN